MANIDSSIFCFSSQKAIMPATAELRPTFFSVIFSFFFDSPININISWMLTSKHEEILDSCSFFLFLPVSMLFFSLGVQ